MIPGINNSRNLPVHPGHLLLDVICTGSDVISMQMPTTVYDSPVTGVPLFG
jgi:hypothetical protein